MTSTAPVLALRLYDAMAGSITHLQGAIADRKMTGSSFGLHLTEQDAKFKALDRGRGAIVDLRNYHTELVVAKTVLERFNWKVWCEEGLRGIYGHETEEAKAELTSAQQSFQGRQLIPLFADALRAVDDYLAYRRAIEAASSTSWGVTPDCALSNHLQENGIIKVDANKICAFLGAVLVKHLALVTDADISDIWTLSITNASKIKFQELTQQHAHDAEKAAKPLSQRASLAQMHAFLEEL
jgi:hypothetical protein